MIGSATISAAAIAERLTRHDIRDPLAPIIVRPEAILHIPFHQPREIPGMRNVRTTRLFATLLLAATAFILLEPRMAGQPSTPATATAPVFKVDPTWPLEMPNKWILGAVTGVFV